MIFAPESIDLILSGVKTQTRRPVVKWRDMAVVRGAHILYQAAHVADRNWKVMAVVMLDEELDKERLKWEVGRTYAMNPPPPKGVKARMGKQVGRILLKGIRCERVCDISDEDAMVEGVVKVDDFLDSVPEEERRELAYSIKFKSVHYHGPTPREAFLRGWRSFYKSDLTELVWVLEFEVAR